MYLVLEFIYFWVLPRVLHTGDSGTFKRDSNKLYEKIALKHKDEFIHH